MELPLRAAIDVEPVNPLEVSPDPGVMGQMYIGAREAYPDGMTLACATPKAPFSYEEIKAFYEIQYSAPGFSDVDFFNEYFEITQPNDESFLAQPGETLGDYLRAIRPRFIFPNTKQGHFDIWLPYNRSVAGAGRFGEHSFLWDGYHMAKGYAADGRWDLVFDIIDNTEYEINKFGYPLNGSADFYVTRAQPDYFAHMVRMAADEFGPDVLVRYLPALEKEHMGYWMDGMEELAALPDDGEVHAHRSLVRLPDGSFLNRYWDDGKGPRLESYKEDVEIADKAVAALTRDDLMDLILARVESDNLPDLTPDELDELIAYMREGAREKIYQSLRAGAASGWDYSSRWFEDGSTIHTINTIDILPVDHNSLLAYNEETLAMAYEAKAAEKGSDRLACLEKVATYRQMAGRRIAAINKYMWDSEGKIFRDYNFAKGHQTQIVSAAMAYPLYVGIADEAQSFGVMEALEKELLYPGGIIATTTENSEQQWDGGTREGTRSKNVWAPPNWAVVRGLGRMAHKLAMLQPETDVEPLLELAETIKRNYMHGIEAAFETHGVVPEKHRGDTPEVLAGGGEYELVKALAMSGETYIAFANLNPRAAADHLPMGRLALADAA